MMSLQNGGIVRAVNRMWTQVVVAIQRNIVKQDDFP